MTNSEQKRSGLMSPSNDISSLKRLWFVLLLIFDMANAQINFVPSSDGQVKTSPNCDFTGNDIGSIRNSNLAQCGVSCAGNANCDHFTYNPTTLTCWIKKPPAGSNTAAENSPGNFCGYVIARAQATCDCDYFQPNGGITDVRANILQFLFGGGSGCKVSKQAPSGQVDIY